MSRSPSRPIRRSVKTQAAPMALPEDEAPAAPRPAIWAEGRQAPAFEPKAFAEAGMLLARETSGAALEYLSSEAAASAARMETQDWRLEQRLGRVARVLPTAPGVARSLGGLAQHAGAARRLLYGQSDPEPAIEPPAPALGLHLVRPAKPEPAAPHPDSSGDPDLAAIRALLRAAPDPAPVQRPAAAAPAPASWEVPPTPDETVLRRVLDWSLVRVLAGSVLVFATPIGYGRALYRHLDGADLREIVADCHRMRIN